MRLVAIIVALILPISAASGGPSLAAPRAGDTFEIRQEYETQDQSDDGSSSGSSSGHTTIIERVVSVREDGLELQYDLPAEATAEDRSREWQFPARLFRPFRGSPQLLNRADLEARIDAWLKLAKLTRDACGTWYFTWNAFKVECDPQTVLASLEEYNLWVADLAEGMAYRTPQAREAAPLERIAGSNPASFVAEMVIDPDKWRQEQAEADVVVAQILGKPKTLDEALRARSSEAVSGTIAVTFDTDESGVRKRTELVKLMIKSPDGKVETKTRTEKVERHKLARPN
jgi:hypothetical protein